jgi:hypothetical protein
MEAGPLNARLKRKLADLGKALSEALAESSDASRKLSELREEGYSVYLLLECAGERGVRASDPAPAVRADGAPALTAQRQLSGRQLNGQRQLTGRGRPAGEPRLEAAPQAAPQAEPAFLIDGRDLAFLRSVGIDPTRSPRRKRS